MLLDKPQQMETLSIVLVSLDVSGCPGQRCPEMPRRPPPGTVLHLIPHISKGH